MRPVRIISAVIFAAAVAVTGCSTHAAAGDLGHPDHPSLASHADTNDL